MALRTFSLSALKDLQNGEIDAQFGEIVAQVVKELEQRPHITKARKVSLDFEFSPLMVSGALDDVMVKVSFKSTVPKYESRVYSMTPKTDGSLVFAPASPDEPRQMTLDQ